MRITRQQNDSNPPQALTVIAKHNFDTPKDDIKLLDPPYMALSNKVASYIMYEAKGLDGSWPKMDIEIPPIITGVGMSFRTITADTVEVWAEGITHLSHPIDNANFGWFTGHGPRKIIIHAPNLTSRRLWFNDNLSRYKDYRRD